MNLSFSSSKVFNLIWLSSASLSLFALMQFSSLKADFILFTSTEFEIPFFSKKLKALLHKIKNFGNHWAHPDFCLYDEDWLEIRDKKEFARLSLEFLDRYFADEYEIDSLVENAPKSKKELESE